MRRVGVVRIAVLALLGSVVFAQLVLRPTRARHSAFATPGHAIVCAGEHGRDGTTFLWCTEPAGLRPSTDGDCSRDEHQSHATVELAQMGAGHRAECLESFDSGPFASVRRGHDGRFDVPTLEPGATWELGGTRCALHGSTLTCRNAAHHGFVLSPGRWRPV